MSRGTRLSGLVCGLLVFVGTASALAQPPFGGFGRGPGGPGGPPPGGMGPGGGGGDPTLRLLGMAEVQKELELMDDQIASLKAVDEDYRQKRQKEFASLRDLPRDQIRAKFGELQEKQRAWNEEALKKVQEILLPPQYDRLHEISIQVRGVSALSDPKVQEEIGLSEEQKNKLKEIRGKVETQMRAMFEGMRGQSPEQMRARMSEGREKMQSMRKEIEEQTMQVLTAAQRDKFEQMKGKKLDIQMPRFGPGGPGDGNRRRGNPGGGPPQP
jgi:Spy/CpxP family protein refolding chaperone